jgi:hypothetical protein
LRRWLNRTRLQVLRKAKQRKKKIQWLERMHTFQMNSLLTLTSLTIVIAHWTIFGADDSHSHLVVFGAMSSAMRPTATSNGDVHQFN